MNEFKLSNGMRVIHKENSAHPLVTAQIFMPSGSVFETEKQAGLASFTQVIMMKSTGKRSEKQLGMDLEDIGATMPSDIDYDFSNIGISAVTRYFDRSMELLADVTFNPDFDKKEIEKERVNTLAGLKSRQDHISNVTNDKFNALFYGDHPYSWPEIGKPETVSSFKREDLVAWHSRYYVPANMTLIINGDVTLETAKAISEKYLGGIRAATTLKAPVTPVPAVPKAAKEIVINDKFQQAYLMIGFPAPAVGKPDYAALKVINAMLGSRMSGRLFTELREKLSLGYEVNSFYPSRKQLSRFVIYLGLQKKNLELAKKRIGEILLDLKTVPVSETELTETKNYIKGIYLMDHQTITRQAWYAGWWEVMGMGHDYDEKYLATLMAVTAADIKKTANKYFTDDYVQVEVMSADSKKKDQ